MPNSNQKQGSGSGAKTVAAFAVGAIAGALGAAAAWYYSTSEEEQQNQSRQYYHTNHPARQPTPDRGNDTTEEKEKDEKDGSITMCEICFSSFAELNQCGVQIVSTPCGHVYCRDCIVGALAAKRECPHCRSEVHDGQLRRLYL